MRYINTILIVVTILGYGCKYLVSDNLNEIKSPIKDNWIKVYDNSSLLLTGITFVDDTTGYAVGAIGCMLKTTDSGENWSIIDSIETPSPSFTDIAFFDKYIGLAVGSAGRISRTSDGGVTWNTSYLSLGNRISNICIIDEHVCFCTMGNLIYKSSDTGLKWDEVYSYPNPYLVFTELSFGSKDVGYGVLARTGENMSGDIIKTTNNGSEWSLLSVETTPAYMSCYFITNKIGYVSDLDGKLYKTTDSGNSWFFPSSVTLDGYTKLHFFTENTGYGCKLNGELIKSIDGGMSWEKVISGNLSSINAICYNQKSKSLFVVGNEGKIYKCSNPFFN
ncbi:MAG: hypothetical protein M0Q21_09495 [Ignavibacteriaceae bacterium]|nr:hypothetical protein [Ignavibacteriaceae bacterium]